MRRSDDEFSEVIRRGISPAACILILDGNGVTAIFWYPHALEVFQAKQPYSCVDPQISTSAVFEFEKCDVDSLTTFHAEIFPVQGSSSFFSLRSSFSFRYPGTVVAVFTESKTLYFEILQLACRATATSHEPRDLEL